jgi:hypothetical protein
MTMEPRLQTSVLVNALLRHAQAAGGYGAVIAKGDSGAGSVLVILAEKGRKARILERLLQREGEYSWQDIGMETLANDEAAEKFLVRRRKSDPDLWVLELDVPSAERFAAQMGESV